MAIGTAHGSRGGPSSSARALADGQAGPAAVQAVQERAGLAERGWPAPTARTAPPEPRGPRGEASARRSASAPPGVQHRRRPRRLQHLEQVARGPRKASGAYRLLGGSSRGRRRCAALPRFCEASCSGRQRARRPLAEAQAPAAPAAPASPRRKFMSTVSAMSSALCPGRGETGAGEEGPGPAGRAGGTRGCQDSLRSCGGTRRETGLRGATRSASTCPLHLSQTRPRAKRPFMSRKSALRNKSHFNLQ